jgi:hypothetical protein
MTIRTKTLTFTPEASCHQIDNYTVYGWPKKLREQYQAEWNSAHPQPKLGEFELMHDGTEVFSFPPDYDDKAQHLANFFQAVRSRKPVVEDVVFGHHAAIGCHMANTSYFNRTAVVWDATAKKIKSA